MEQPKVSVYVQGSFFILLSLMLLVLPFSWVLAVILAVVVHECFHAATIAILSGRIYSLNLGAGGIQMETESLSPGREMLAAVSGPLGSALLMLLAPWMPRTAICGMVHCVYNLIPIHPLDGGRILACTLEMLFPGKRGEGIFRLSQIVLRFLVLIVCMIMGWQWGILPILVIFLLFKWKRKSRTV